MQLQYELRCLIYLMKIHLHLNAISFKDALSVFCYDLVEKLWSANGGDFISLYVHALS